jgi:hypothetical protein
LDRYNVDFHHMVNTAQGAAEETAKAQGVLEAVMEAFAKSAAQDRKAAASLEDSTRREAHAKEAAAAAAQRYAPPLYLTRVFLFLTALRLFN